MLRADPDLGVVEAKLLGVAVDLLPAFNRVMAEVDVMRREVEADKKGRYRLALELLRGLHTTRVILPDSGVVAGEVRVRVL